MKYIFTLLLSALFAALTYASAPDEFNAYDLGLLGSLLLVVFGAEILIARIFVRYQFIHNAMLAGFATLNILFLNLALNNDFTLLPKYGQILALLVALFILITFMKILDENPRLARILPIVLAFATTGILAQVFLEAAPVPVQKSLIEPGKTSAKNIRSVEFKIKPNVYFISFDSMIPKPLLQKHLSLETTAYHEVLHTHFRRINNFFAVGFPTRPSLNGLLALDAEHYSEATRNGTAKQFFPGLTPSPLLEIFKHNGYETTTLFHGRYFGNDKGPHVDNYQISDKGLKHGACEFIPTEGFRMLTFMGYCFLTRTEIFRSIVERFGLTDTLGINDKLTTTEFLMTHMRAGLRKGIPQFFFSYIISPGHTPGSFDPNSESDLEEYRQYYFKESKNTAKHINTIVAFITEEDPDAIVYLFGDHGPWLSRGGTMEKNDVFFVQDRFGVYGGIYPPDRCSEFFSKPDNRKFITTVQGALKIIECLSDGKTAVSKFEGGRSPNSETRNSIRYEDYLYE
ncbi:MAG: sulfatase-like hydrolase/transferase [Alphaproteobacteria bacterium]|nr:sulfatase-like hydrolase/transferase [Alphaproteobacteria bacterium]